MKSKKNIREQKGHGRTKRVKGTKKVIYLAGKQIIIFRNKADL